MIDLLTNILILVDRHKAILSRKKHKPVSVDKIWLGFKGRENFIRWSLANGFKPELEIDRRNNKLGYSPENCQWISGEENRVKDYRVHEYQGKLYTLGEIHTLGKGKSSFKTFKLRIWSGWSIEEALSFPPNRGNKHTRKTK